MICDCRLVRESVIMFHMRPACACTLLLLQPTQTHTQHRIEPKTHTSTQNTTHILTTKHVILHLFCTHKTHINSWELLTTNKQNQHLMLGKGNRSPRTTAPNVSPFCSPRCRVAECFFGVCVCMECVSTPQAQETQTPQRLEHGAGVVYGLRLHKCVYCECSV